VAEVKKGKHGASPDSRHFSAIVRTSGMTTTLSDLIGLKTLMQGEPHATALAPKTYMGVDLTLIAEVLVAARAAIASPHRWMKGGYGETREGHCITGFSEIGIFSQRQIYTLCAWGAVGYGTFWTVGPRLNRNDVERAATALLETAIGGELTGWNDAPGRTHADVLNGFDRAIAMAVGAWR
jgi:hypothetical protein